MIETIIDTPVRTTPHLGFLREKGVTTIIRYYNHRNSSVLPEKRITREEAQAICEHGMTVGVVFQQNGRELSDFSVAKGATDSRRALDCASDIGQPEGSTIYFGVDHDFYRSSEIPAIMDHFSAIQSEVGTSYKIGAYASGGLASRMLGAGLIDHAWLPRALGWSGSRDFHRAGKWDLFQNQVDIRLGALPIDTNIANPARGGFGAFSVLDAPALPQNEDRQPHLHVVIARSGLHLRAGAGTGFKVLQTLPMGAIVDVLDISDPDWALVSLQGDMSADGYMYKGFLVDFMAGH
ncbi:glycoside hydrolase domain-containing protein [Aquisalinus flavus]|uniref:DUF1906 domain-containing protein n=1 Tax=Aquisalinus flavus TaxID=1526572 RepID=A0A8J2V4Z5_9PROT|nr:glycoside hydrolase domain-containing protein [Aquisalinus flavus]MBD0427641.1 DUF1906 domain-containing protein [Aquisalinus flavus]UNE47428.1 DUF1906 domain-containing protein [Aquisalinus flavus]GGD02634.1 hypothetical protein GCM10011342_09550 [Aquisalinus flavus]